jgi:hypothetical protein
MKVQKIRVKLMNPKTGNYHIATACWCKETTSFISFKKIKQLKLLRSVNNLNQTIKLTMEIPTEAEDDSDHDEYDGTLFRVIRDDGIRYDIAIGSNWNADEDLQDDDNPELLPPSDEKSEKSEDSEEEAEDSDEYVHVPSDRSSLGQSLGKCRR